MTPIILMLLGQVVIECGGGQVVTVQCPPAPMAGSWAYRSTYCMTGPGPGYVRWDQGPLPHRNYPLGPGSSTSSLYGSYFYQHNAWLEWYWLGQLVPMCRSGDLDGDGDIDLQDVAVFQRALLLSPR